MWTRYLFTSTVSGYQFLFFSTPILSPYLFCSLIVISIAILGTISCVSDCISVLSDPFICLHMIESSAHGDEYDGVIFSQLVCIKSLVIRLTPDINIHPVQV